MWELPFFKVTLPPDDHVICRYWTHLEIFLLSALQLSREGKHQDFLKRVVKGILDPLERVIKVNKEYHQVYQWLVFYLCFTGGNWTWLRLRRVRQLSKKNIFDLFIGFLTPLFCPGNDWKILNKHPTQPKVLGISMSSLLVIHQPW